MTATEFRRIPLIRTFPSTDPETGDLYKHEVRRDPDTGLTLTARFAINPPINPNERRPSHG